MNIEHTFVICAYGDSQYLEECIQSLKNQTIQSAIILYTSTPSNYIKELCSQYEIPFYTAEGGTIGKDWNNAISFVNTDLVTIAHQDDRYHEQYVEEILANYREEALILYSNYVELKNNQPIPATVNLKIKNFMLAVMDLMPSTQLWRKRILAFGNPICCPAVTYNMRKLGGFQFRTDMKVSLDWYAWYEISQRLGQFIYVGKKLMYHRIHSESETSNSIGNKQRTNEDFQMYRLFWPKWIAKILLNYYVKSQESNY